MSDSTECRLLVELVRVVPLTILGLMTWWISRQQKEISRQATADHSAKAEIRPL